MNEKTEILNRLSSYNQTATVKEMESIRDELNGLIFSRVKGTPQELIDLANRICSDIWHAENVQEAREIISDILERYS